MNWARMVPGLGFTGAGEPYSHGINQWWPALAVPTVARVLNDITSLTWRSLTSGDAQASADLINANEAVDRVGEFYTAEDTSKS